jgi:hypothetical protein
MSAPIIYTFKIRKTKFYLKLQWEGKRFLSNDKQWFIIVEYINWYKIFIQFDEKNELCLTSLYNIKNGYVK